MVVAMAVLMAEMWGIEKAAKMVGMKAALKVDATAEKKVVC